MTSRVQKSVPQVREKLETQIAMQTDAGREGLKVYRDVLRKMTGEQRVAKAFEMTEQARQTMRAGIRQRNPTATEQQIQHLYVDQLLSYHGYSLAKIRRLQREARSKT